MQVRPEQLACSLTSTEFGDRARQWQAVLDDALVDRTAIPGGIRLTFVPRRSVVHHLVDLVDGERQCCGWAAWTLTATHDAAVIDVTAATADVDALRSLFQVTA